MRCSGCDQSPGQFQPLRECHITALPIAHTYADSHAHSYVYSDTNANPDIYSGANANGDSGSNASLHA